LKRNKIEYQKMKTKRLTVLWMFALLLTTVAAKAQIPGISPELKEMIELSVNKDRKIAENQIDRDIALSQRQAVRMTYVPKLELGGKYVFAKSHLDGEIGNITGFEGISKLQEFMQNPAFPAMFPGLAGMTEEVMRLQQLMAQQGMALPALSKEMDGDFSGNYFGLDATASMVLFSGGQVPNISKALSAKASAQEALSEKSTTEVIADVIAYYDRLALLSQSQRVLDESAIRLTAEKQYAVSALNNGFATAFDTLRIAVAEANLQAKRAEFSAKKTLLHQKLAQLTGKPAESFNKIQPMLEPMIYASNNGNIEQRPEFSALTEGVEAQKHLLRAEQSHYLPKIQALASVRYDNLYNADASFKSPLPMGMDINHMALGPTFMAGVGFKWELFDLSGGTAKVRQAKLEVRKAQNSLEEARELLELNQVKTTSTYQAALEQVNYKNVQRLTARRALELAQKSYNAGMINITERLAVENEVQQAEMEYLQAVFAERQAALECYKATGDLNLGNVL
jgi:outer membrane protein TolC